MIPYLLEMETNNQDDAKKKILELMRLEGEDAKQIEFETIGKSGIGRFLKRGPTLVRAHYKGAPETISMDLLLRSIIHNIFDKMEIDAEIIDIYQEDKMFHVDIESEQSSFIIGKKGRMLDTLQFLVNLLTYLNARSKRRVILNVSGYRDRRKETLENLASKIRTQVLRTKKPRTLEFMNPYERRILHLFLEEDPEVTTESLGTGVYKRLQILPIRNTSEESDEQSDENFTPSNTNRLDKRGRRPDKQGNIIAPETDKKEPADKGNVWQDPRVDADDIDGNLAKNDPESQNR